jgi:hypothetical protein
MNYIDLESLSSTVTHLCHTAFPSVTFFQTGAAQEDPASTGQGAVLTRLKMFQWGTGRKIGILGWDGLVNNLMGALLFRYSTL